MNPKLEFKPSQKVWSLGLVVTIFSTILAIGYNSSATTLEEELFFYGAFFGNTFMYCALGLFLTVYPLFKFKAVKTATLGALVLCSAWFIFLWTDIGVFNLYHFHVNLAMLDLWVNAGGEVISFGLKDTLSIIGQALAMVLLAGVGVFLGLKVGPRFKRGGTLGVSVAVLAIIGSNLGFALDYGLQTNIVTTQAEKVIFFKPLTMNSALRKMGVISATQEAPKGTKAVASSALYYPRQPLQYKDKPKEATLTSSPNLVSSYTSSSPYNIIVVMVDALRSDVVDKTTMPHLAQLAQENISFTRHFSGGNATRTGVFSFFYGIPSFYWKQSLYSNTPPVLMQVLKDHGYEIKAFSSANLLNPEFNRTVFYGVEDLRTNSKGTNAAERDQDVLQDFASYLKSRAPNKSLATKSNPLALESNTLPAQSKPFMAFVFLDQLHAQRLTDGDLKLPLPYPVQQTSPNYLSLNNDSDREPFFNLYRNTAFVVDQKIGRLVAELKASGVWDNSIVIFTADHGEEFNDTKLNYWGHNGNFTRYQIQIPLIISWPGRKPFTETQRITTAYDVSATLIHDYFLSVNEILDYSVGQSLFTPAAKPTPPRWFMSGSYLENAIISPDQIAVIKAAGNISYLTPEYRPLPKDQTNRQVVMEALKQQGLYLQKPNEYW